MSEWSQVVWHEPAVSRAERERLAGHAACVVWFTGLSGSGKSTIANLVDRMLYQRRVRSFVLDGDNIRHGLNATVQMLSVHHSESFADRFGLGFSAQDREENIRRVAAVAELFCAAGVVTLTAFVSPYRRDRLLARQMITEHGRPEDFLEVFVDAPLNVCEARDPKGLYKMARSGAVPHFTGIDDPYEPPPSPDLRLDSGQTPPRQLADQVVSLLERRGILPRSTS